MLNKRRALCLILCTLLLMGMVGCSKNSKSTTTDKSSVTATQQNSDSSSGNAETQETSGIMGQVKSISGNSITLALVKMPDKAAAPAGNSSDKAGPPAAGNPPADQGQNKQQAAPPNAGSIQLTGETKTITVPSGIKIMSGNKDNEKEVSISEIKVGDMLQVQLNGDTVEQVRVMPAGQSNNPQSAPKQN